MRKIVRLLKVKGGQAERRGGEKGVEGGGRGSWSERAGEHTFSKSPYWRMDHHAADQILVTM